MKVKELIEKLQTFDPELVVIIPGYYETDEPNPKLLTRDFSTNYWDRYARIITIPADTPYIELL